MSTEKLSPREQQVLKLIADGVTREEISESLGISKYTYDDHRKSIRIKLNIRNNADWTKVLWGITNKSK